MALNLKIREIYRCLILLGVLLVLSAGCMNWETSASGGADVSSGVSVTEEEPLPVESENPLKLEVGIEPTPVPTTVTYSSTRFGFQFNYPETWRVAEIDQGVEVWKGNVRLMIQAWREDSQESSVRWYGMPAGDLLYRDKLPFLGEVLPVSYLIYDGKIKQVLYNEGNTIASGDLQLLIYLESQETEYDSIDLSEEILAEVKTILKTFHRTELVDPPEETKGGICATDRENPHTGWAVFRNESYGFYLYHPQDMQVDEVKHLLELQQGDLTMRIEYRKLDEAYPLTGNLPEGEVELIRFETYFGDQNPNPIVVERRGGQITRVSVGNLISRETPVQFMVTITSASGSAVDLAQANAMLEVLDYLCLTD